MAGATDDLDITQVVCTAPPDWYDVVMIQRGIMSFAVTTFAPIALVYDVTQDSPIVLVQATFRSLDAPDICHVL